MSSLSSGVSHAAIVTADLERLVEFYAGVFDAEVLDVPVQPGAERAALVRLAPSCALALLEVPESPHATGHGPELARGHVDHLALDVASADTLAEVGRRLVARGASDGAVSDYGAMVCVGFTDPDGMRSEVCWVRDPAGPLDLRVPSRVQLEEVPA